METPQAADCIAGRLDRLQTIMNLGLLNRVFPAERVLLGLRTCRWLYHDLLDHVDSVVLVGQQLDEHSCESITRTLLRLRSLKSILKFRTNPPQDTESSKHIEAMWGALWGGFGGGVVQLDLSGNKVGAAEHHGCCEKLAQVLQQCTELRHLNLRQNNMFARSDEQGVLMHGIASCTSLTSLNLRDNEMAFKKGAEELMLLISSLPNLRHLDIESNSLGWMGIGRLAPTFGACTALADLRVGNNKLTQLGGLFFVGLLRQCCRLTRLDINDNWIYSSGVQRFAPALPDCTTLAHLDMAGNDIRGDGATYLSQMLPDCPSLTWLDVSRNKIRAEGAAMLAAALGGCGTLTSLNLSQNWFGDQGTCALAERLPACTALRHLSLARNRILSGGAASMAAAMGGCWNLRTLDLRENELAQGAGRILRELGSCRQLTLVDMGSNCVGDDAARAWEREGWFEGRRRGGRVRVRLGNNEILGAAEMLREEFAECVFEFD